jgi:regulator of sigma E protease
MRLPDELNAWADAHKAVQVTLTVLRDDPKTGKERDKVKLPTVDWDASERWRFDRERGVSESTPLAIAPLGIAYRVETAVGGVSGPAAEAGLKPNDVIEKVRFKVAPRKPGEKETDVSAPLKPDQWAAAFVSLQSPDVVTVELTVAGKKDPVSLKPVLDETWPLPERGLLLAPDTRLQRANSIGQALYMGLYDTGTTILDVYGNLRGMITGRISFTNVGGPLTIGVVAYKFAGMGFWELIFFLGMISANLAVINFLPIPFLDGGHMVFLCYEWVRGRPAPETVQAVATWAGLGLLALLMVTVLILDVGRWIVPLVW